MVFVIRKLRARKAKGQDASALTESVMRLSGLAGIPRPRVYLTDAPAVSLLSIGWSPHNSAIVGNPYSIRNLDRQELDAVVAHEISHIQHYDGLTRTILIFSVGILVFLGYGLVQSILHGAPRSKKSFLIKFVTFALFLVVLPFLIPWVWIVGMLMKQVLSQQEYRADMESVCLIHDWAALARALIKLAPPLHNWGRSTDGLIYLFDIIVPSFDQSTFEKMFDVHPSLSGRLERLLRWRGATAKLSETTTAQEGGATLSEYEDSRRQRKWRQGLWIAVVLSVCVVLDGLIIWFVGSQ